MKVEDIIIKSLNEIERYFKKDELAYLSLTTKNEIQIRDRLVYIINLKIRDDLIASREWKRVDLAILQKEDKNPLALIEVKSMYSFDAMSKKILDKYLGFLEKDIKKIKKYKNEKTSLYNLLLVTHPKGKISKDFQGVVKYLGYINRYLHKYGDINLSKGAKEIIDNKLSKKIIKEGIISAGKSFNTEVEVFYFLIKEPK